jgi:hypothetical protein
MAGVLGCELSYAVEPDALRDVVGISDQTIRDSGAGVALAQIPCWQRTRVAAHARARHPDAGG